MGGCEEDGTFDGGGKVTQGRITDADGAKVPAKKRGENLSNVDKTRMTKKESRKNHALSKLIRNPVCL